MPYVYVDRIAVSEGAATASFVIRLDAASLSEIRLNYSQDNGTALNGSDYTYSAGTLTFAPGETSKTVQVPIINGAVVEATEFFWLELNSAVGAVIGQRYTPALIFDNDASLGTPAVTVGDVVVDEMARTANFFVSLNRPAAGVVSMNFSTTDDTATAGQDYAASAGALSFAPGEMVKTVTVNLSDDGVAEADERFQLVLTNVAGATLADGVAVATIGRNDAAPVASPQLFAWPLAASEGDTFATFVVQLSAPSLNEVRVNYSQDNGTARNGSDFSYDTGTLVFAPGETLKTLPVPVLDDTTAEPTQLFWLDLTGAINATVAQRYTPALIHDNDGNTGTPAISVSDLTIDEAALTASFFVSLDRPATSTVTVAYSSADDTARAGQDYRAGAGTLSFAPGEMVKTVSFDLFDDTTAETDEFFQVRLANPGNATLADATGVALIGRNDTAPTSTPYITARVAAASEGDTLASFVVQLSAPSLNEVRVNFSHDNGTAANGSDYSYYTGTLVFAPGETLRTLPVAVLDNTTAESTELFWLDLSGPVNAIVAQRYTPALIFDNDGTTGTPAVSVSDVVVDESAQTANFSVWLSGPSTSTVTVTYASADDSARAASDYTAVAGSLSFAPGEMVKTVCVTIVNDSLAETDERFQLLLSNPAGATLADAIGAALIARSDTATVARPQVLATPLLVSEGDILANFVIQLSAPSRNPVSVNFGHDDGTAANGSDYSYHTGTLNFAPGETVKLLPVPILNDTAIESAEAFSLDLSNPVNATVPQRYTVATINDNDGGGNVFSYGLSHDVYSVSSVLDRVIESPGGGIDTVRTSISYTLPDNVENGVLTGNALNLLGNTNNNIFKGTAAANTFDGKEGVDTVIFSGPLADYTLLGSLATRTVASVADGNDTLFAVERLQFSDTIRASDTAPGGNVWAAYAMFNAGFDRAPSTAELSMWTAQLDRLGSAQALAQAMINFYAPGVPDEALVAHLWGTIVETPIPLDALSTYVGLVANGSFTQASLLEFVSTFELNTVEIVGIVGSTLALDPAFFPIPG